MTDTGNQSLERRFSTLLMSVVETPENLLKLPRVIKKMTQMQEELVQYDTALYMIKSSFTGSLERDFDPERHELYGDMFRTTVELMRLIYALVPPLTTEQFGEACEEMKRSAQQYSFNKPLLSVLSRIGDEGPKEVLATFEEMAFHQFSQPEFLTHDPEKRVEFFHVFTHIWELLILIPNTDFINMYLEESEVDQIRGAAV